MSANSEPMPTAGLVVIGNEILTGKITDTNTPYLCRELSFLGVALRRISTIPDDFEQIGREVRTFSEAYTHVFTSGGIGPTHDDVTIPAIAAAFGVEAQVHPRLERAIRQRYGKRCTEAHLLMARVPEGAELIELEGLYMPQVKFRNVFILPGVPELFQYKFNAIKHRFRGRPSELRQLFLRADEGSVAAALRETEERHPGVLIGSYPSFFNSDYSLKVTLEGRDADTVAAAWDYLQARLAELSVTVVQRA